MPTTPKSAPAPTIQSVIMINHKSYLMPTAKATAVINLLSMAREVSADVFYGLSKSKAEPGGPPMVELRLLGK